MADSDAHAPDVGDIAFMASPIITPASPIAEEGSSPVMPGPVEKKKDGKEEMRLKVYARVRPAFPGELNEKNGSFFALELGDDRKTITLRERQYEFDDVFPGDTKQSEIFDKVAKPTIDNAFDGFTGTVFVYGQTGTGKTHTMSNRAADFDDQGIIPRAINYLFDRIRNDTNHSYEVTIQYLQLYRDNLQDLQSPDTPFLKLENAPDGGTRISGVLTSPPITSVDHFFEVYDEADKNRVVAETMMNKQSSRGHSVLTVFVKRSASESQPGLNGKLVFVDLAGYERLKKTMITDDIRKHEAQAINLSLSALATCIAAITAKSSHIPFRNSRLTRVLYDSLVGNSVTSVIITMGPSSLHTTETVNTLYFGHNAIQCKTSVKRDLGPVDWQKEAITWKKRANELSTKMTQVEAENALLVSKLRGAGLDVPVLDNRAAGVAGGSVVRGGAPPEGLEKLLKELQKAKDDLDLANVEKGRSETEAEEAKIELEEMGWLLEREKSKSLEHDAMQDDLKKQLADLQQQAVLLTEQLEIADRQLSQIVPTEDLRPSTTPRRLPPTDLTEPSPKRGLEPVFLEYDSTRFGTWCELVNAELSRHLVKASEFDRAHWFVSIPDMASFVSDDRRNVSDLYWTKTEIAVSPSNDPLHVRIEGEPVCRRQVSLGVEGAAVDDLTEIKWESSKNGFDFASILTQPRASKLMITADLVHKYIRVSVATKSKRASSGLVYVNIDGTIDDQLQHFATQGGVQFAVGLIDAKTNTTTGKYALTVECNGALNLRMTGDRPDVSFQLANVMITPSPIHDRRVLVEEHDPKTLKPVEGKPSVSVETTMPRDRELLVLAVRLFKALRKSWVAEALLGDCAEAWATGAWLKMRDGNSRRALQLRLRTVARTGHWASEHMSPSRRAGGHATFFQRAEEAADMPPRYQSTAVVVTPTAAANAPNAQAVANGAPSISVNMNSTVAGGNATFRVDHSPTFPIEDPSSLAVQSPLDLTTSRVSFEKALPEENEAKEAQEKKEGKEVTKAVASPTHSSTSYTRMESNMPPVSRHPSTTSHSHKRGTNRDLSKDTRPRFTTPSTPSPMTANPPSFSRAPGTPSQFPTQRRGNVFAIAGMGGRRVSLSHQSTPSPTASGQNVNFASATSGKGSGPPPLSKSLLRVHETYQIASEVSTVGSSDEDNAVETRSRRRRSVQVISG